MPKVSITHEAKTLVIVFTGEVSRDAILAVIDEHYPNLGSRSTLWDFTGISKAVFTKEDLAAIATRAAMKMPRDTSRKTAYAVADQANYLQACKYLNEAIYVRLAAEYAVFTSVRAAREWLARP